MNIGVPSDLETQNIVDDVLGGPGQTHMPKMTPLVFPNVVAASNAGLGATEIMTPETINERLPSIVDSTPQQLLGTDCDPISQWVKENPLLAWGGLAVAAFLVLKKR